MRDLSIPEGYPPLSGQQRHDAALLRASTELFVQKHTRDRDAIRRFEELAIHLVPRVTQADRIFVAGKLASRIDAPASVVCLLARDAIEIAEPVLRNSPVLGTLDLLSVVAGTGPAHHRLVAQRTGLSAEVERALRLAGDSVVVETLDRREPSAAAGAVAVGTEAQGAIQARPSVQTRRRSPDTDSPGQKRSGAAYKDQFGPWSFLALDREARLRLVAEIAGRPAVERRAGAADRLGRAFHSIIAANQLVGLARTGNREALVEAIVDGLAIPSDFVVACLDDRSGEPLAVLLKGLGLDNVQAQQVMLLVSPVGRDPTGFFKVCDVFAGMEPTVAETLVEAWRIGGSLAARHQPLFADTQDRGRGGADAGRPRQPLAKRAADARDSS